MINLPRNKQEWSLALMIIFYLAAGINHFRMPGFYLPLIPDYLPGKTWWNVWSGLSEIVAAIMLAFPATRRMACYGILVLLVLFIPSHIWFIQQHGCVDPRGLCVPEWVAWLRLLLVHPLLMLWAWSHR